MLGWAPWLVEGSLLPACQADNLAMVARLCLPETLTHLSLFLGQREWGEVGEMSTQTMVGGREQGPGLASHRSLKVFLFSVNVSIPERQGWKGPLLQCSSCPCPSRELKAGHGQQPAKRRQLFRRRV